MAQMGFTGVAVYGVYGAVTVWLADAPTIEGPLVYTMLVCDTHWPKTSLAVSTRRVCLGRVEAVSFGPNVLAFVPGRVGQAAASHVLRTAQQSLV